MGNRLVCCRLSWTSFSNSEEDLSHYPTYQSRFQFTNQGAFCPPIVTPVQPFILPPDDNYNCFLTYCPKSAQLCTPDPSVQHISEREPEDDNFDPSLNATKSTIFIQSLLRTIHQRPSLRNMLISANREMMKHPRNSLKRWSSCGTVYISDGCLSKPDAKLILHCVSVAVCSLIRPEKKNLASNSRKHFRTSDCDPLIDHQCDQSPSLTSTNDLKDECVILPELYKEVYDIYDERVHPLFPTSSSCQRESQFSLEGLPHTMLRFQQPILHFLNRLFSSSLITAESAIASLVYLERLISGLELHVVSWSWRRQLLSCILIASKVLDDQAVWNADYCQLLKDVEVEDLNDLERHTLSLLQFNTGVPPSVYARYYFDLLYLGDLVSFTDLFSQPTRRRLTPRIACRMRILPDSPEVRAEQCSSSIGAAGGGGLVFDLPCRHQGNVEVVRRGRATTPLKTSTSNRQSKEIIESMLSFIGSPDQGTRQQPQSPTHHHHPGHSYTTSTPSSSSSSSSTYSPSSCSFVPPPAVLNNFNDPWKPFDAMAAQANSAFHAVNFGGTGSDGRGVVASSSHHSATTAHYLLQQDTGLF